MLFLQKSHYFLLSDSFLFCSHLLYNICQKSKYLRFINVHVETFAVYWKINTWTFGFQVLLIMNNLFCLTSIFVEFFFLLTLPESLEGRRKGNELQVLWNMVYKWAWAFVSNFIIRRNFLYKGTSACESENLLDVQVLCPEEA